MKVRMTPAEVARRLNVGTRAVYTMLEQGILPGIRLGRRWILTRQAYNEWEKTCGLRGDLYPDNPALLHSQPEVPVLN